MEYLYKGIKNPENRTFDVDPGTEHAITGHGFNSRTTHFAKKTKYSNLLMSRQFESRNFSFPDTCHAHTKVLGSTPGSF